VGKFYIRGCKRQREKNIHIATRFLRSSEDFEPVVLMNFNNSWHQTTPDIKNETENKSTPTEFNEMQHKKMILQVLAIEKNYKDLITEIQEVTAKGYKLRKETL